MNYQEQLEEIIYETPIVADAFISDFMIEHSLDKMSKPFAYRHKGKMRIRIENNTYIPYTHIAEIKHLKYGPPVIQTIYMIIEKYPKLLHYKVLSLLGLNIISTYYTHNIIDLEFVKQALRHILKNSFVDEFILLDSVNSPYFINALKYNISYISNIDILNIILYKYTFNTNEYLVILNQFDFNINIYYTYTILGLFNPNSIILLSYRNLYCNFNIGMLCYTALFGLKEQYDYLVGLGLGIKTWSKEFEDTLKTMLDLKTFKNEIRNQNDVNKRISVYFNNIDKIEDVPFIDLVKQCIIQINEKEFEKYKKLPQYAYQMILKN